MNELSKASLNLVPHPSSVRVQDTVSGLQLEDSASVVINKIRCWDLSLVTLNFKNKFKESKSYTHIYWIQLTNDISYGFRGATECLKIEDDLEIPRGKWVMLCVLHNEKSTRLFLGGLIDEITFHRQYQRGCSQDMLDKIGPGCYLAQAISFPYVLSADALEALRKVTTPLLGKVADQTAGANQTDMFLHNNKLIESATINISATDKTLFNNGIPVLNNNSPMYVPEYTESNEYTHFYWFLRVKEDEDLAGLTHENDSCLYMKEGLVGVYSRRDGLFRQTNHKLTSKDWICLAAVATGTKHGKGKTRFFVGSRSRKFSYVGSSDRTCGGEKSNSLGFNNNGLGLVNRVLVWSRKLSVDELEIVRVSTSHTTPAETVSTDAKTVSPINETNHVFYALATGCCIYFGCMMIFR